MAGTWGATIVAALLVALGAVGIARRAPRKRRSAHAPPTATPPAANAAAPAFANETVSGVLDESLRLAFGVARFDYQIMGEHAAVLERVETEVAGAVHRPEYFPRRPMLLPRLLKALNDDESSRRELVRLILEDPSLADAVLKLANSAFYRRSPEPVEDLQRAVVLLGVDGLRSLTAAAILQPVFRLPKGFFDNFAAFTWDYAQRAATAAEACARTERRCDPLIAQVLGLLGALARLVIFRFTLHCYRDHPNVLPRAEVFIRAIQAHEAQVARLIAAEWGLSESSLTALDEQRNRVSPAAMSALSRAVYFGELCGALALLERHGAYSHDGAQALLIDQGLAAATASLTWRAARGGS